MLPAVGTEWFSGEDKFSLGNVTEYIVSVYISVSLCAMIAIYILAAIRFQGFSFPVCSC